MTLIDAIRIAAEYGCELVPVDEGRRYLIRAISYDADPYEIDERRLLALSADEFAREWVPPHYDV